jgi:hypothetical protein
VTDNGAPPLSDEISVQFQVSVSDSFEISARSVAPDRIELRWPADVGSRYRVESRDTVNGTWKLLSEVTATGTTAAFQESVSSTATRFYRIVLP